LEKWLLVAVKPSLRS
jgi:hypothetical protein